MISNRRGFTLLEVLVATLLMGVAVAVFTRSSLRYNAAELVEARQVKELAGPLAF